MLRAVFLQKAVLQTSGGNYSSLFWPLVYRPEHQSSSWYTTHSEPPLPFGCATQNRWIISIMQATWMRWPIKSIYLYWFTSLHKRASCLWLNWEKQKNKIYNTIQSAFSKRLNSREKKKKTLHKLKFWLVHLFTFVPLNTQFYSQIFNLCLL